MEVSGGERLVIRYSRDSCDTFLCMYSVWAAQSRTGQYRIWGEYLIVASTHGSQTVHRWFTDGPQMVHRWPTDGSRAAHNSQERGVDTIQHVCLYSVVRSTVLYCTVQTLRYDGIIVS